MKTSFCRQIWLELKIRIRIYHAYVQRFIWSVKCPYKFSWLCVMLFSIILPLPYGTYVRSYTIYASWIQPLCIVHRKSEQKLIIDKSFDLGPIAMVLLFTVSQFEIHCLQFRSTININIYKKNVTSTYSSSIKIQSTHKAQFRNQKKRDVYASMILAM